MNQIQLNIESKEQLKSIYLPFLKKGGLVIPYNADLQMGDNVDLLIQLWDEPEQLKTAAKVVWLATETTNTPKFRGIGVELCHDSENNIQKKLEIHLAGCL